jgi:hypothetical protein
MHRRSEESTEQNTYHTRIESKSNQALNNNASSTWDWKLFEGSSIVWVGLRAPDEWSVLSGGRFFGTRFGELRRPDRKSGSISGEASPPVHSYKSNLICLTPKMSETVAWRDLCPRAARKQHRS